MSETVTAGRVAWEPLTPRGVAAFADASLSRLWLVQLLVAMLATGSVAWFFKTAWFPVIREAIHALPADGEIVNGELSWQGGDTSTQLAENNFLGLAVDLFHSGELGRSSDLQIEFGRRDFRIYLPLLSCEVISYPGGEGMPFNETELEPWWGAWQPWILAIISFVVMLGLLVAWQALATLYCLPVWLIGFCLKRGLSVRESWRLAGAATLPGALFLTGGIIAYDLHAIDLIRLVAVFVLHFIIGWIYVAISPCFCPKAVKLVISESEPVANPFARAEPAPMKLETKTRKAPENPFQQNPAPDDK